MVLIIGINWIHWKYWVKIKVKSDDLKKIALSRDLTD